MTNDGIMLAGYRLKGPYKDGTVWNEVPAVYVPLNGPVENPLDVGETENLKERLANHERRPCWEKHATEGLYFAVRVEESESERQKIERLIRGSYDLPCGEI